MKLAFKLVGAFMLGNVLLAALYGYLTVRHEAGIFRQRARDEAESLGRALEGTLADAWRRTGHQGVLEIVRRASPQEQRLHIRWVWFDAPPADPFSPSATPDQLTATTIQQHLVVPAVDAEGVARLHIYWPVALEAERKGGLEISREFEELEASKREILLDTALLIGGMVLISGALAAVLGVRIVGSPLQRLIDKTRRAGAGDFTGPIDLRSGDELAELAESLNRMCEQIAASQEKIREETAGRIAALEQLRHADRLKTVGRLASGIAHELGTPLNVIAGQATLIASGKLSPEDVRRSAAAIKDEADRVTRIIRQLLDFARRSTPRKAPVDLRQVIRRTADLLSSLAEKRGVRICVAETDDPAMAIVDAGQIEQVLANLVVNAIQAMPSDGNVEIAVGRRRGRPPGDRAQPEADYYCIEVRDYGVGIAEEHLEHLFEPFFTTKGVGEGTGLGLSIAYGIVQEHGGWIEVSSTPGKGSRFSAFLPREPNP